MRKWQTITSEMADIAKNYHYGADQYMLRLISELESNLCQWEETDLAKFRSVLSKIGPVQTVTHENRAVIEVSDFVGVNTISYYFENGKLLRSS
jgi:hypothetical protein